MCLLLENALRNDTRQHTGQMIVEAFRIQYQVEERPVSIAIIGQAVGLFTVTNIDDIVIPALFFRPSDRPKTRAAGHHWTVSRLRGHPRRLNSRSAGCQPAPRGVHPVLGAAAIDPGSARRPSRPGTTTAPAPTTTSPPPKTTARRATAAASRPRPAQVCWPWPRSPWPTAETTSGSTLQCSPPPALEDSSPTPRCSCCWLHCGASRGALPRPTAPPSSRAISLGTHPAARSTRQYWTDHPDRAPRLRPLTSRVDR